MLDQLVEKRHKITSLWQLQIDPSELPPEGTVTGAAASRLGAHVGARIRQLREAQLAAERAANASTTLRGQTKDRNGDKKLTSSDNEFITMGAPAENDKHSTENHVVIMTANSNKKTKTSEDDAVKIKKPSPDTKGNLKTNDIAARNIKYPASENHENMRKVIPLDLKDDDDLSDRDEDVMQFKEETIHLKTITTPEQTLELRLTVSDVSNLTSNYSPTQRRQSGFDSSDRRGSVDARRGSVDARRGSLDVRRGSIDSRRGSLLSPDLIKILPGDDEDACDICRRNSEPFARYNRSFSISSDYIMPNIPESESDSKRGSFFSDENLEAISLKLDAIVVNAEYIESRARDGEERHELEEEAARTQGALDDVAILDREEMQERVTRAARALARCRMILEERAPSIASYETMDRRRSSAVADQQIIRSVALRVMALDSQEAARRRTDSDRRGSIDSRRGSIQEGRRGSMY
ncbi:hypothetical protein B566_EDAN015679 [Ephemera danica]|nr:hypothetical protein B566_EDAN015679 [Ephemera danica]